MVSREKFIAATGHPPVNDDLKRCNCPDAGLAGHYFCGWCEECDKPRFICSHLIKLKVTDVQSQ